MLQRWIVFFAVVGLGIVLSGCTKCGPIWEDWMQGPKSCRSDHI